MTAVAVVIATLHRPDDVAGALESIGRLTLPPVEVHVVDPAVREQTRVEAERRGAGYAGLPGAGLGAALNRGIALAGDVELIAVTGDDCVVDPDWLDRLVAAFARDERIAIVFGTVRSGPCDPEIGFVPGCALDGETLVDSLDEIHRLSGTTACMGIRRSAWARLGGFDEALGGGTRLRSGEDLDLSLRALRAGFSILQAPDVATEHLTLVRWADRSRVVRSNWLGSGAAFAKSVKLAGWPMLHALARLAGRWRGGGSGVAATYGVTPDRLAMLTGFATGFLIGLLRPVDRRRGTFRRLPKHR